MTTRTVQAGDFVHSHCGKCKKETKHVAVALVKGVPAKVQCTVCKGNHAYAKNPATTAMTRVRTALRSAETKDWLAASAQWDENKAIPYSAAGIFRKGDILRHGTFGLGLVRGVLGYNHMRVLFEQGEKTMQCGN